MSRHTEKLLIEWGGYDVLSVLKDERGQRYLSYFLSLNSGYPVRVYMTTEVSTENLIGLLDCKIPPRDVLTMNSLVWVDNGHPDTSIQIPLSFLPTDLLPYENMCFGNSKPWKDYLEDLKKEYK